MTAEVHNKPYTPGMENYFSFGSPRQIISKELRTEGKPPETNYLLKARVSNPLSAVILINCVFILSSVCLATGPQSLPKRVVYIVYMLYKLHNDRDG
jgi:hypothetical protein